MSKFDTHGGYFAPKDYMRVNEGGSHEENPNGGVQIGVDPEGNPNLLEEGEPVYNDYVYSDNIEADEKFLTDNNLPKKYTGRLYSKIADDFVSEAEERPLDPISRNGLEAMLTRLANAQEGQKQAKEQADLEAELANLSPEELDELEAVLAQPEQGMVPEEQMGFGVPMEQQPADMPMMCGGGAMHRFDYGGEIPPVTEEELRSNLNYGKNYTPVQMPSILELALGSDNPVVQGVKKAQDWMENSKVGRVVDALLPDNATEAFAPLGHVGKAGKMAYSAADIETQVAKWSSEYDAAQKAYEAAQKVVKTGKDAAGNAVASDVAKAGKEQARKALRLAKQEFQRWSGMRQPEVAASAGAQVAESGKKKNFWKDFAIGSGVATGIGGAGYLYNKIDDLSKDIKENSGTPIPYKPVVDSVATAQPQLDTIDLGAVDLSFLDDANIKERGGKINKYDGGGWADFLKRLADYRYSLNPSAVAGKYAIDRRYDVWGGRTAEDIEADKAYQDFTNYVLANSNDPNVRAYLHALDNGVAAGVPRLFNGDELVDGWDRLFKDRRTDKHLGIYHLNPEDIGFLTAPAASAATAQTPQSIDTQYELFPGQLAALQYGTMMDNLSPRMRYAMTYNGNKPDTAVVDKSKDTDPTFNGGMLEPATVSPKQGKADTGLLPTWPRYAGAIGSGLLGLYNTFQQPDRYTATRIPVHTPEGRIHLQNQVYNPIDQNMIANAQIAQGNATRRALQNSGMGPSTGAAILAADNNLTGNLGTGFIQSWDANNQRRNAVIAANNQAEAQRAQFDANLDYYRKEALNKAAMYNAQNDLMIQRLNNAAEGDKYTAISNQIANGLQALSGIGQENFAMNQINTNPAFLGYGVGAHGGQFYNPRTGRWEKIDGKTKS